METVMNEEKAPLSEFGNYAPDKEPDNLEPPSERVEVTVYTVRCTRCQQPMQLDKPPKTTGFLCNGCWMKWKEVKDKLIGKVYEDELNNQFISFVNTRPWQ